MKPRKPLQRKTLLSRGTLKPAKNVLKAKKIVLPRLPSLSELEAPGISLKLEDALFPPRSRKPARCKRPAMTKARKAARNQPCMIRLPGCDGGGETSILAHYRLAGTSGAGMKPEDEQGAHACFHCHEVVDGRMKAPEGYTKSDIRLAHAEGVLRTQAILRGNLKHV